MTHRMPRVNRRFLVLLAVAASSISALSVTSSGQPGSGRGAVRLSSYDQQVNTLLATMTLDEKVGQMTQPDQQFLKDESDIETLFLGSLLSGGDSDPNTNTMQDWSAMYERYQARTAKTRLKIPLLYGVDALHGHNNVIGAVVFPHNIGLGATRNAKLVEQIGRITADEVRATGINWTFAPCVTVPQDERWGRAYEGYSEDPAIVAELGAAAVRGLQGSDLSNPMSVLACAKHYMGDGGTTFGTGMPSPQAPGGRFPLDRGDTRGEEQALRRIHMAGYVTTVRSGVGTIMPSYSSWNGEQMSGHKRLLTDVLKGELGFEGFLISDYDAIDALAPNYRDAVRISINAGMDMVMVPQKYREFIAALKSLVQAGEVPMSRIDDAVRRILRVKVAMKLMDPATNLKADVQQQRAFGSAEHRAVARQAVRESLVLLKNDNNRLPLPRNLPRIHVAGKNADDIGNQCGGWTITWQGQSGAVTTGGTTVLAAIKKAVSPATTISYSKDGTGAQGASVGVVVIGETPYAEMNGDRADLSLAPEDVQAVENIRKAGIPMVVVLISGRPMIVNDVLKASDALLAAWLPGTEGDGIADVLFGAHAPTGRLSFSWPRSTDQIPVNVGDATYDPLFRVGYGLSYARR